MPEEIGGKAGWMKRFVEHARLKPDTPWEKRREIRKLENQTDRYEWWIHAIVIVMMLIVIAIELLCVVHFNIAFV